ncbi:hypothetical protein BS78_09G163300 [Paspalum vaginatum]|nr:hypothetical protein BS78_09G163300 [Paspalum vaginatum]
MKWPFDCAPTASPRPGIALNRQNADCSGVGAERIGRPFCTGSWERKIPALRAPSSAPSLRSLVCPQAAAPPGHRALARRRRPPAPALPLRTHQAAAALPLPQAVGPSHRSPGPSLSRRCEVEVERRGRGRPNRGGVVAVVHDGGRRGAVAVAFSVGSHRTRGPWLCDPHTTRRRPWRHAGPAGGLDGGAGAAGGGGQRRRWSLVLLAGRRACCRGRR